MATISGQTKGGGEPGGKYREQSEMWGRGCQVGRNIEHFIVVMI